MIGASFFWNATASEFTSSVLPGWWNRPLVVRDAYLCLYDQGLFSSKSFDDVKDVDRILLGQLVQCIQDAAENTTPTDSIPTDIKGQTASCLRREPKQIVMEKQAFHSFL